MSDKKVQAEANANVEPAVNSLDRLKNKAIETGKAVGDAGATGAAGLEQMAQAAKGAGAETERVAERTTSAQKSIAKAIALSVKQAQNAQAELLTGSRGTPEFFDALTKIQNTGPNATITKRTQELRELVNANNELKTSQENVAKATSAFDAAFSQSSSAARKAIDDLKNFASGGVATASTLRAMADAIPGGGGAKYEGQIAELQKLEAEAEQARIAIKALKDEQSRKVAGQAMVDDFSRQLESVGKSADQLILMKAELHGVSAEITPMLAALRLAEAEERQVAEATNAFKLALSGASAEAKKTIGELQRLSGSAQPVSERLREMASAIPGGGSKYEGQIAELQKLEAEAERAGRAIKELKDQQSRKAAGQAMVDDFSRQLSTVGKSADELILLKAEMNGVVGEIAPMLSALRLAEAEQKQAAEATNAFKTALAGASNEARKTINEYQQLAGSAKPVSEQLRTMAASMPNGGAQFDGMISDLQKLEAEAKQAAAGIKQVKDAAARQTKADNFLAELTQQTNSIGKTTLQLLEMRAAELGVADAAAPMIARMKEAGLAGKEMAWALRSLPMQFTDIVVSLQGGMNPLTVLFQQGGQLKDMFGGIVPAIRAMGTYLVGLMNPVTLTVAGAAAMVYAYDATSKSIREFNKAIILSGNQLGMTASQMQAAADAAGAFDGVTVGAASEVIRKIAADSRVGAQGLAEFTAAAIQMEHAGGPAVETMSKGFSELAKEPSKAALTLNSSVQFLTASLYDQIRTLEDQGRTTEAAKLAQEALARSLKEKAPEMLEQLGLLDRGWLAVKTSILGAFDAAKGLGRPQTDEENYKAKQGQIRDQEAQIAQYRTLGFTEMARSAEVGLALMKKELSDLAVKLTLKEKEAALAREEGKNLEALKRWKDSAVGDEKREAQASSARAQAEADGERLITAGLLTKLQLKARLKAIDEANKDPDAAKSERDALALAKAGYEAEIANARGLAQAKTAEIEKEAAILEARKSAGLVDGPKYYEERIKLVNRLAEAKAQQLEGENKLLQSQRLSGAEAIRRDQKIAENNRAAAEARKAGGHEVELLGIRNDGDTKKIVEEGIKANDQWVKSLNQSAKGVEDQAQALEDEREAMKLMIGTTMSLKEAMEKLAIQRLEAKRATLLNNGESDAAAAIQREITARNRLGQVETWKAGQEESEKAAKKAAKDWDETAKKINTSLTDALMNAFESGKSFADAFKQFLVDSFKSAVLKPTIAAILKPASDSITGLVTGQSKNGSSLSSSDSSALGQISSTLSSISGVFKSGYQVAQNGGMADALSGAGSMIGSGQVLSGITQGAGALSSMGPYAAAAFAGYQLAQGISGGYSLTGGDGSNSVKNSAILGGVGSAITMGLANRLFGRKLTESGIEGAFSADGFSGNAYNYYKGGTFRSNKTTRSALDEGVSSGLAQSAQSAYNTVASYADAVGLATSEIEDYTYSFKANLKGLSEEDAAAKLEEELNKFKEGLSKEYQAQLDSMRHLGEDYFDALERLFNVQSWSESMNSLGGVFSRVARLSVDAKEDMADMAGSLETLAENAQSFVQNYYSSAEIAGIKATDIQSALSEVGITTSLSSKDDFRALVESIDVSTEEGQKQLVTLLDIQGDFADVAEYMSDVGKTLAEVAQSAPDSGSLASIFDSEGAQAQLDALNNVNLNLTTISDKLTTLINVTQNAQGVFEVTG